MIRVDDLWKTYKGASSPTLKGVSFEVKPGSIAAILGKSGAGKSTLLRVLSGLEPFDKGVVDVAGKPLLGNVGLVFQSLELFPHLSVLENLLLAPVKIHHKPGSASLKKALGLLRDLDLSEKAKAYPEALSGGQKQRVAIARALMVEPQVLLYDEPTSALDPELKAEVGKTLKAVAQKTGMTQVVVTHDPKLAEDTCDAVFVLDAGILTPRALKPVTATATTAPTAG
jgi:ABC-type polar amino acid transport system ATPase subunit